MTKKDRIWIFSLTVVGCLIIFLYSCKKPDSKANDSVISVADKDGNIYKTVTIDTQFWMAENLKTTSYNDGTSIPLVIDSTAWINLIAPGYCWYKNNANLYKDTYGALYNWYAVNTGKLCPVGWHVPTDAEWTILTTYLGGENVAGGKLKEAGTIHWRSPNVGATNESFFTALPSGFRIIFPGTDRAIGFDIGLWSSTEGNMSGAFGRYIDYNSGAIGNSRINYYSKKYGFSVRCLKDN